MHLQQRVLDFGPYPENKVKYNCVPLKTLLRKSACSEDNRLEPSKMRERAFNPKYLRVSSYIG